MKPLMVPGNPRTESYGGVEVHVNHLTHCLSQMNDIHLCILTYGRKTEEFEKNSIQFDILKRLTHKKILYLFYLPIDLCRLIKETKKLNPDLVHIQGTHPLYSLFGILISKRYPTVITVHGFLNEEYKFENGLQKVFDRFFSAPLERLALSKIPNIIAVCPQLKEMIEEISNSKVFVIPNGIDLKFIESIKAFKTFERPSVFYLGNLIELKGVDTLIRAISIVKKEVEDVKLFIAGRGKSEPNLRKLVREMDLDQSVEFLGFLGEEKFSYMKSIDVFVLPSYWESFPLVLLEAMACGKPVIATNVSGNPFAIRNGVNGFLFNPGDINKLADKLITLLQDEKLSNKMGDAGKKRAMDFEWIDIAGKTANIYRKILIE